MKTTMEVKATGVRAMTSHAIPLTVAGDSLDPRAELAPGVLGYAMEANGAICIPSIMAACGDVGRFLDSLPVDRIVRFPSGAASWRNASTDEHVHIMERDMTTHRTTLEAKR
jgi:hypothetical protein